MGYSINKFVFLGSRQFYKYESKKALSFVNYVHYLSAANETMNLFVTLSFADLHEPALHRLLPGSERYLGKTVVSSLADIPPGADPEQFIDSATDHLLRSEAVAKNCDLCSEYLNKKFWSFYRNVLKPLGVIDYIVRVEFQYRWV